MALSAHPGQRRPSFQPELLVRQSVAQPSDSAVGPTSNPPNALEVGPQKQEGLQKPKPKVSLRADGWWVVDQDEHDLAGPFSTIAQVEDYLDWHSNQ